MPSAVRIRSLPLLALLVLGLPGVARADVSGPDIVSFLNAQRAANGIPAGIAEDPTLSGGCFAHNNYGAANGVLTHYEDPSLPGYSPQGDQAARTSVLYPAGLGPWTGTSNPFEQAPIHLHQLLAPRIDRLGAAETRGYGCATTLASRNRAAPATDVTYTYPGAGATAWPPAQTADEAPYTPGQQIGIPAGTSTGPYLYVMFDGPDLTPFDEATATGVALSGPSGPVDVAYVDNTTAGLQGYLPTGLELIPRRPLAPSTTYTATVTANVTTQGGNGPARPFSYSWSFTTGERRDEGPASTIPGRTTETTTTGGSGSTTPPRPGDDDPPEERPELPDVAWSATASFDGRRVRLTVRCDRTCRVRGSGAATARGVKRAPLATRSASRSGAGTVRLSFPLSTRARRVMRHSGRRITLNLRVANARGSVSTGTLRLR